MYAKLHSRKGNLLIRLIITAFFGFLGRCADLSAYMACFLFLQKQ